MSTKPLGGILLYYIAALSNCDKVKHTFILRILFFCACIDISVG